MTHRICQQVITRKANFLDNIRCERFFADRYAYAEPASLSYMGLSLLLTTVVLSTLSASSCIFEQSALVKM